MSEGHILTALDGSNPLAFLAALGALRLIHLGNSRKPVKLRWVRNGIWQPELLGIEDSEESLCERLVAAAKQCLPVNIFSKLLGKNITVDPNTFAAFAQAAYQAALAGDRQTSDFAAAFGCEICKQEGKDRIEYTDLCFVTGSGHQHFLGTMEGLHKNDTAGHIRDALFGAWAREKGFSMRWDPADAAEYAFRWSDPSSEGASAVWGANLLAVHALPLFPTQPTSMGLRTTGFRDGSPWPEFTWPIWIHPIALEAIGSLLAMQELHSKENELNHATLRALGIEEIYRASRVRIGQGANFKVSFRPARAV